VAGGLIFHFLGTAFEKHWIIYLSNREKQYSNDYRSKTEKGYRP